MKRRLFDILVLQSLYCRCLDIGLFTRFFIIGHFWGMYVYIYICHAISSKSHNYKSQTTAQKCICKHWIECNKELTSTRFPSRSWPNCSSFGGPNRKTPSGFFRGIFTCVSVKFIVFVLQCHRLRQTQTNVGMLFQERRTIAAVRALW